MYEELLKQLRCRDALWRNRYGEGTVLGEAADAIEDLQKLTDAQLDIIKQYQVYLTKHHWIPVAERLPEEAKEVLALDNNGDFCIAWVIEFVGSKGTYSEWACADGWSDTQLPITHWMPLPEPPKEE